MNSWKNLLIELFIFTFNIIFYVGNLRIFQHILFATKSACCFTKTVVRENFELCRKIYFYSFSRSERIFFIFSIFHILRENLRVEFFMRELKLSDFKKKL